MCDTLVSLTSDGVLFAKNSDRHANEAQSVTWHPAVDHAPGATVACTWTTVAQAAHTHAVVLSQPWWMWGAEMGANEHGVVIGNEAVFTKAPAGPPSLLGMDLVRLALERATTAEDAASVLIALLEAHGQGGPCSAADPSFRYDNSFMIADPNGAIVVETAGRAWATETVTGRGRSISNGLTIAGFAAAHADPLRDRLGSCVIRRARTQASADAAEGPGDLFAALRDHGDDPSPQWSRVYGALRAPCAHAGGRITSTQTTGSWVADLRAAPLHWATGTGAPCTSTFKPVRVDRPVGLGPSGAGHHDPDSRWWHHEQLHRLVLRDHAASVARFAGERDALERAWLAAPPATGEAFATVDRLEARWLADLEAANLPDRRPRWLRTQWQSLDDDAALPARAKEVA